MRPHRQLSGSIGRQRTGPPKDVAIASRHPSCPEGTQFALAFIDAKVRQKAEKVQSPATVPLSIQTILLLRASLNAHCAIRMTAAYELHSFIESAHRLGPAAHRGVASSDVPPTVL